MKNRKKLWQKPLAAALMLGAVCMASATAQAVDRHYYIAADEVVWDYAPSFPINNMSGDLFNDDQLVFVGDGDPLGVDDVIGREYIKAIYQEYTDGTFSTLKTRGPNEEHLGILGPVIRAEVGDTIFVHFKNNGSFPYSVHPHGVFYDKNSEGAPYADGTIQKNDDIVPPGGEHLYTWGVPRRAGPGPADPDSIAWVYHSHTDETRDTNAGLIGPIVITRNGRANPDATPKDVDREFFTLFTVFDENVSILADQNIAEFTNAENPDPDAFEESNLMHGMNGLVYGNNLGYNMNVGDKVRWYIIGMGTEVDLHTPHWHGTTLLHQGSRLDVAEILPAASKTFDLIPDNPGIWMYHCHVNDHIDAGMMTVFNVQP